MIAFIIYIVGIIVVMRCSYLIGKMYGKTLQDVKVQIIISESKSETICMKANDRVIGMYLAQKIIGYIGEVDKKPKV